MTARQTDRNREIAYKVRIEGWSQAAVASVYRLSPTRISQIVEETDLFPIPHEPELQSEIRKRIDFHVDRAALLAQQVSSELEKAQNARDELMALVSHYAHRAKPFVALLLVLALGVFSVDLSDLSV